MIDSETSDWGKGRLQPPASRSGRAFGVVVLTAFLVMWLTGTIGMSRFAAGFAPAVFSVVPLMMAVVGALLIGGSIVRLLFQPAETDSQRNAAREERRPTERSISESVACDYCGVLGPVTRTKCTSCGAPHRG